LRWKLAIPAMVVVTAAVVFGAASGAAASRSAGWLYSIGLQGRGYFDADKSGWTGAEEIIACDEKADGHSTYVAALDFEFNTLAWVIDTHDNGACTSRAGNFIEDERTVWLEVCDYEGSTGKLWDCAYANGVS
jgi:hypothetical protein